MEFSSPRFKSLVVTLGISFWSFVLFSVSQSFSLEIFLIFVITLFTITQIFTKKLSKVLDTLAIINTKIFLGILFYTLISTYGVLFKLLRIDLLRLKKQSNSYWLDVEETKPYRIRKHY